jgi:hypothetical protein
MVVFCCLPGSDGTETEQRPYDLASIVYELWLVILSATVDALTVIRQELRQWIDLAGT